MATPAPPQTPLPRRMPHPFTPRTTASRRTPITQKPAPLTPPSKTSTFTTSLTLPPTPPHTPHRNSINLAASAPVAITPTTPLRTRIDLLSQAAVSNIQPIATPTHQWTADTQLVLANNIGTLLVGGAVTAQEKAVADRMHRRLRRKVVRAGEARDPDGKVLKARDADGNILDETESDETDGESPRAKRAKIATAAANAAAAVPGAVVVPPNPEPGDTTYMSSTVSQLRPLIPIADLRPQPLQIPYARPSRGDRSDAWFMSAFRLLYREISVFAETYYCMHDLKSAGTFFEPWGDVVHTPEFLWWVEQVATPDPVTGWDSLLRNTGERKSLVMGVLMRVLRAKVFDEELFGADEREAELMMGIEKTLFLSEGFHRTNLRSCTVRSLLGNGSVTGNFYPSVAKLTAQIYLLLEPLTTYIHGIPPPHGTTMPLIQDLYQSLHNLVSRAAHLSLTVRLSPTIFHLVDVFPGSTYEPDDVFATEPEIFTASKERIVNPYNRARADWVTAKNSARATVNALLSRGPTALANEIEANKRIYLASYKTSARGIADDLEDAREVLVGAEAEAAKTPRYGVQDVENQREHLYEAMRRVIPGPDKTAGEEQKKRDIASRQRILHEYIEESKEGLDWKVGEARQRITELEVKEASTTDFEVQNARRVYEASAAKVPGATQKEIDAAQMELARIDNSMPTPPGQNYRALTKIGVWPVITRYKPGGEDDDDAWAEDGPIGLGEKDGMRIFQISKGVAVNFYGREDTRYGGSGKVGLRRWLREKRRALGKQDGNGRKKRGVVGKIVDVAGKAAVVGVGALGWCWMTGVDVNTMSTGLENVFHFVGNAATAVAA